jgi:hypothetical protein
VTEVPEPDIEIETTPPTPMMRVPVKWGPGRHGPGNNLFLFVHDPDGNWVELSAEIEVVAPDRPLGFWPHEERTLNSWGSAPLRS